MKVSYATIAMSLVLGACAAGDNPGDVLDGNWAGADGRVIAGSHGVLITFACGAVVRIPSAVRFEEVGHFSVVDTVRGTLDGSARDTLPGHPLYPYRFDGYIAGDQLTIYLSPTNREPETLGFKFQAFQGRLGGSADSTRVCRN